jgi:D-alanyl-D-alanine carboxypeptidase
MTNKARHALWQRLGIPADYAVRRALPVQREAGPLTRIGLNSAGRPIQLMPQAAAAWRRMHASATQSGITLVPLSGFRSVARQTKIIRDKLAAGAAIDDILRFVAAPGCSEHHTGRALDIGRQVDADLDGHFARTPEFRWLKLHAVRFGFHLSYPRGNCHGIGYEPWHWCWRP